MMELLLVTFFIVALGHDRPDFLLTHNISDKGKWKNRLKVAHI